MKIIYEVYNKFNESIVLQTESETLATNRCDELNKPFEDKNPFDRPWVITSEIVSDSYEIN